MRFLTPVLGASVLLLAVAPACKSSSDGGQTASNTTPPPPAICKPHADLPASGYFQEVTSDVGLDGVIGIRVSSADLDGDGLPDLIFHLAGVQTRDDLSMKTFDRRVFMNKGGTFVDATAESGLLDSRDGPMTGRLGALSVFADVDNDGDIDMFEGVYSDGTAKAPATDDKSEIMLNDGKGHFTFADRSGPSTHVVPTAAASFADIDKDGAIDLFYTTWYGIGSSEGAGSYLFMGDGSGAFADVSKASGLLRPATGGTIQAMMAGKNRKPAYGSTICDIDNDGDQDILVSSYGRAYNELWRNDSGTFTEVGFGTTFAADDDLKYQDNEFYHCWCAQNAGMCPASVPMPKIDCTNFSWTPGVDDQAPRLGGNNFTTACADLDNDGDLDLIHAGIKHWHIGESADTSQILRNDLDKGSLSFARLPNSDKTLQRVHTTSDWNEGDIVVGAFDFDNDGKKDVYLGSSDYPDTYGWLFHQNADGSFTNVADASGVKHYHAVAFASVDIDGDGDLDLVVATSGARCSGDPKCPTTPTAKVYRNVVGDTRNSIKVRLHGGGLGASNAAGIGARVSVTAGGVTQVQEVSGGYGTFGVQHDTVLTFGLGDACTVDKLEVKWPNADGTVESFEAVQANYLVDVTEGKGIKYVVK
jgi:hypothetical protein